MRERKRGDFLIYTVTLNPAIDYFLRLGTPIRSGEVNRAVGDRMYAGGKGINAAVILRRLGHEVTSLGFTAGVIGEAVEECLQDEQIISDMIRLPSGNTRVNVKLCAERITEINGRGPDIEKAAFAALLRRMESLSGGDVLVLSGNVPPSLPADAYCQILEALGDRQVLTVVDTSGNAFGATLAYRPFLVKPNLAELSAFFDCEISGMRQAAKYARRLCEFGVSNALVSLGVEGALLATQTGDLYEIPAVPVKIVNTVGCGDSMVAGFLAGILDSDDLVRALRLGCAAGSATAGADWLARREEIEELYQVTAGTVRSRRLASNPV